MSSVFNLQNGNNSNNNNNNVIISTKLLSGLNEIIKVEHLGCHLMCRKYSTQGKQSIVIFSNLPKITQLLNVRVWMEAQWKPSESPVETQHYFTQECCGVSSGKTHSDIMEEAISLTWLRQQLRKMKMWFQLWGVEGSRREERKQVGQTIPSMHTSRALVFSEPD